MDHPAITDEPRWITEPMLLAIHAQQIERYGGRHGVRDGNLVLSALARPINRWAYDHECDYADLASAYLVGFGCAQGFVDGNKRTALARALVFLALNGLTIRVAPPELYAITMAVATNQADDARVAAFLRERVRRRG
ncbi:MAG TPA: type II toxin-antitoxin system death-on-curing family toxin [Gemmatimonadaceae bacterium]|nr:type II toxin-antitoxin system death-on-curing family toxin [Gemmatimonadaceae bacterium]